MITVVVGCALCAILGWFLTGYAMLASTRVERVNPIWQNAALQAFGFALAITSSVSASVLGHWWWGVLVLLITPSVAVLICHQISPRPE